MRFMRYICVRVLIGGWHDAMNRDIGEAGLLDGHSHSRIEISTHHCPASTIALLIEFERNYKLQVQYMAWSFHVLLQD